MATWLWVTSLAPKNDWIELKSLSVGSSRSPSGRVGGGSQNVATFMLDPGPFRMPLYSWFFRGGERDVYVFVDPQTEYTFSKSILTSVQATGNDGTMTLGIDYEKLSVTYSGAP